jgi:SEC-C motif-containing protein
MRSRYSAYVLGLDDYLNATWHPDTRPESLDTSLDTSPVRWLGLEVKRHKRQDDDHAIVEFVARYRSNGRGHRLHETSRFVRENGRWLYVDGNFATPGETRPPAAEERG